MPEPPTWLSSREHAIAAQLHVPKRHREWLLGRWTAKRALARLAGKTAGEEGTFELLADSDGAPHAYEQNELLPWSVSLSHRDDQAACAISSAPVLVGCDLERVEPRSERFVKDFFTVQERSRVADLEGDSRDLLVALTWSAKESTLKALHVGLRRDTRSVELISREQRPGNTWNPLSVVDTQSPPRTFHGWWCQRGGHVLTLVASPPPTRPMAINP